MTFRLFAVSLVVALTTTHCNFSDTRQKDDPSQGAPRSGDASGTGTGEAGGGATQDAYPRLQAELFNTTCARCHNPGRSAAGVDLTSYESVKQNAAQAHGEIDAGAMPPSGAAVDPVLAQALKCWIDQGAPQTGAGECFPAPAGGAATDSGTSSSTGAGTSSSTGTSPGTTSTTCDDDHPHADDDDCLSHRHGGEDGAES